MKRKEITDDIFSSLSLYGSYITGVNNYVKVQKFQYPNMDQRKDIETNRKELMNILRPHSHYRPIKSCAFTLLYSEWQIILRVIVRCQAQRLQYNLYSFATLF